MNMKECDKYTRKWLEEAAVMIKDSFQKTIAIDTKSGRNDIVTNIDKEIEQFFIERITSVYPDHRIFGEEGMSEQVRDLSGVVWIIDPIDGTLNFVEQQRDFAISVAIYQDGIGLVGYIYDVMRNELYFGWKGKGASLNGEKLPLANPVAGIADNLIIANLSATKKHPHLWEAIRSARGLCLYGAASLEYAAVFTGRAGAYLSAGLAPWDLAAGKIIAEELGYKVTRFDGSPIDMLTKGTSLVAAPKIHEELIRHYL